MLNARMKALLIGALSCAFLMTAPMIVMAASAPGTVNIMNQPGTVDLNAALAKSGMGIMSNVGADPVLGIVPQVSYTFFMSKDQSLAAISSLGGDVMFNPEGFPKFYMDHAGVGRLYYRVYSTQNGWSSWCNSKEVTNTNDDGSRVQAIQIRQKGYINTLTDIYYKVMLNDGTVLDWAKNGQITGAMGNDRYIVAVSICNWAKGTGAPGKTNYLMCANAYEGCYQEPDGRVLYSTFDGRAYTGWGWLDQTQYYYIDGQPAQGWQYVDGYKYYFNPDGSVCTDLEPLIGLPGLYQIKYNKSTRTLYIMTLDPDTGNYIIPYKTFMSSCGPDTPIGTFKTYAKYDWKFMHDSEDGSGSIYCQKLTRFYQGFLMHSLLYYHNASPFALDAINYNFIDDAASGGCIRLRAGDSSWIFNNIPMNTPVIVYENIHEKGPIEKACIEQVIPRDQNYDPTDPEALAAIAAGHAGYIDANTIAANEAAIAQAAADDAAAGITRTE